MVLAIEATSFGKVRSFVKKNISFAAFILMFTVFLITVGPKFVQLSNIQTILEQSAALLVVAVGVTFVILIGAIDLSVGSVVALVGVVAAAVLRDTGNTLLAVGAGLAVGLVTGLINGVLHAYAAVPSFIVTLGMLSVARAVTIIFTSGTVIMVEFESALKTIFGLSPWMLIVAALAAILGWVLQKYTIFGRYTMMIGGDETVARLSGINVRRLKTIVYVVAGAFTALGGVMIAARIGSGSPATGQGYELDVISAVVLGGTSLRGGIGGVRGTILGALTLSMLNNGLVLLGVASDVQLLVKGIVLILAVFVSLERKKDEVVK